MWLSPKRAGRTGLLFLLIVFALAAASLASVAPTLAAQEAPPAAPAPAVDNAAPAPAASVAGDSIPEPPRGPAGTGAGLTAAGVASTGWAKVDGSLGDIRWIVVIPTDPRYAFAAIDGVGLFRSQDAGQSWIMMSTTGLTDKSIQAFAVCPSGKIYAGTWGSGVFRHDPQIQEWTQVNNGLPQLFISAVSCDSQNAALVGTYDKGVYRTTDEGASWVDANSGLRTGPSDRRILALFTLPGIVGLGTVNGAYKSLDGGKTWVSTGLDGQGVYDFAVDRSGGEQIWAGTNSGGVFTSFDQGETWLPLGGPQSIYTVAQGWDLQLYAGTRDSGVYRYEDGKWLIDGLDEKGRKTFLIRAAAFNRLLAGTNDGLWAAVTIPRTPTPTATETPVPTETPTPSRTPTVTPTPVGPRVVASLWSAPEGRIEEGQQLTYFIDYQVVGVGIAASVAVTNAIPLNVELVPGSIAPAGGSSVSGRVVRWELGNLAVGSTGTLSYKVQRIAGATATITSTATNTASPTVSPSPTASITPTSTGTVSPAATSTVTPTITPTDTACSNGKVYGYVFVDANGNGNRDSGEAALSGITMRLHQNGTQVATTNTSGAGYYQFNGVTFGDYELSYDLPAGYATTTARSVPISVRGCRVTRDFGAQLCALLSHTVAPSNSGTVSYDPAPNCEGGTNGENLYNPGTSVTLTANPSLNWSFKNWSGSASGSSSSTTLTVSAATSVTANFEACIALTGAVSPTGSGSVSLGAANCPGGGGTYRPGVPVTVSASANPGYNFSNWSALSGSFASASSAATSFTPSTSNATVTANFA